jgi:predicted phosphodiesterase
MAVIFIVMSLVAVLGDIHANRESLDLILRDIAKRDVSHIVVVGDLVGYGPDPRYVVKRIRDLQESGSYQVIVGAGNHDAITSYKIEHPEMPSQMVVATMGMKGEGAYESMHISCRQLCGDYSRIPTDGRPAKPEILTEETKRVYEDELNKWRDANVEPQTQEAIRAAHSPGYVQSALVDVCNALNLDSQVRLSLARRVSKAPDMARFVLQDAFSRADATSRRAALFYLEQFSMREEDVVLREYLASLKHSLNVEISANGVTVPVFVCHANPFDDPKDPKYRYLYDKADIRKYGIRGSPHTIDEVFVAWNPELGNVVMFGHSHVPGAYEHEDKLIINPGSAGCPRHEEEVTYALWDPSIPGKAGVDIVRFPRFGRRFTEKKMEQLGLPLKPVRVHAGVSR